MTSRVMVRHSAIADPEEQPVVVCSGQTSQIVDELDSIVGKSRRRHHLRRAVRNIGGAFAKWFDGLAAPVETAARSSDLPPQIRFPFF